VNLEGLVPVTGTVTHQGQPVEGAEVVFSPEGQGRAASGKTDASGQFQLTSLNPNDGALRGKYKVAILKREVGESMTADQAKEFFMKHDKGPQVKPVKNALPEKYAKVEESGLTAEVTEGGKNDFTFKLE
jgi:hypothetical protein